MTGSRPYVVVGLLSADQEFQRLQADDARAAADQAGLEAQVVFAENTAVVQIQQLFKFIHRPAAERPKAMVVETVVGEGLERVARAAAEAGIGWILLNRKVTYLDSLRRQHPNLPLALVSTEQEEVGRIQARQFRAIVPSARGEVLYMQGPPDTSAAQDRLNGALEGLKGTELELRLLDGRWTEESGEQAIQRWLALKTSATLQPALVGCQNDAMAVGAARALASCRARPELARVPITGCDGLLEGGRRLVDAGLLAATVVAPSNTGPAIRLLAQALATGRQPPAQVMLAPESYPSENALRALGQKLAGR
jgi:ABC-type sugar transport system substrate-binding protein